MRFLINGYEMRLIIGKKKLKGLGWSGAQRDRHHVAYEFGRQSMCVEVSVCF